MSINDVKKIIDQALADEARFDLLMKQPEEAFKGCDLSESEKGMLRGLAKSPYTQARRGLQDTLRLVMAAIEYDPSPGAPGVSSRPQ